MSWESAATSASGSLSYTVSSSDTDAATTIESGTETIGDELSDGPSQTASYTVNTTMPDHATAYETGTETLGGGGTIGSGSASFTWFDGNSLNRNLTVSGIAATLSITENSTDTYGFGESGTESITTGGADAPGTVSFVWNQMGTDDYQINQGNSASYTLNGTTNTESMTTTYLLNLTDTASSSWHDAGADELTDNDSVVGETDTYQWHQLNSVTDSLNESFTCYYYIGSTNFATDTETGGGMQSFSMADAGCETWSPNDSEGGALSLEAETDTDTLWLSSSHSFEADNSFTSEYHTTTYSIYDPYQTDDVFSLGETETSSESESGSWSWEGDSYSENTTQSLSDSVSVSQFNNGFYLGETWPNGSGYGVSEASTTLSTDIGGVDSTSWEDGSPEGSVQSITSCDDSSYYESDGWGTVSDAPGYLGYPYQYSYDYYYLSEGTTDSLAGGTSDSMWCDSYSESDYGISQGIGTSSTWNHLTTYLYEPDLATTTSAGGEPAGDPVDFFGDAGGGFAEVANYDDLLYDIESDQMVSTLMSSGLNTLINNWWSTTGYGISTNAMAPNGLPVQVGIQSRIAAGER